MKKKQTIKVLSSLFISTFLISNIFAGTVKATTGTVEVSPTNFVILENDLGQKKSITIKNNGSKDLTFTVTECLAEKIDGKLKQIDGALSKSSIELDQTEVTAKANSTATIDTRVRISVNGGSQYPCVLIKAKTTDTTEVSADSSFLIPYVIQNFTGTLNMVINVDIGNSGIVTNPDITITGNVSNTGEKFFTPKGTIVISKNGTQLSETEISSQILGLLMPGEQKPFEVKWVNNLDTFGSIGDYQVEVRISNDQTNKVSIGQLVFTYVSSDVIILAVVIGVALLAIITGIVILKRR